MQEEIIIENSYEHNKVIQIVVNEDTEHEMNLPQTRDYLDMERQYRQIMFVYEAAISQIEAKLHILKGEFQFSNDRNPIETISSRIKSKESILYKMQKKGVPMTMSSLVNCVHDIAGVRIVCPFIEDVYAVARMLVRQKDIEVIQTKDYIRTPKENGYRSFHLVCTVEVPFSERTQKVPVEIQIRTIAMDFWASTEHQLRYKKQRQFSECDQKQLKECADLMSRADEIMQHIVGDFAEEQW